MRRNGLNLYALGVAIVVALAPPMAAMLGSRCGRGTSIPVPPPGAATAARSTAGAPICRAGPPITPGATPDASYAAAKRSVAGQLERLSREYRRAGPMHRGRVVHRARRLLERALRRHLMPHWCGTPWAFHGTSQIPRQGRIACGYFVSTLLRDAGLRVGRVALARRPAEAIIKSLVSDQYIRRFSDVPVRRFVKHLHAMGPGLYIVGLDNHVGFLVVDRGRSAFVHSTYLEPSRVTSEAAVTSPALVASRYRVVGKISADPDLLRKWLTRERIPTR